MKPLIFLTYSEINNYFFILVLKKFFRASKNDFRARRCWLQLARRASCKINFLCTLGHRTMSGQDDYLSGQNLGLAVILAGRVRGF